MQKYSFSTFLGAFWSGLKHKIAGESVIDENAEQHRDQFTSLVKELKNAFRPDNFLVSLTVLPNVNSTGKSRVQLCDYIKLIHF